MCNVKGFDSWVMKSGAEWRYSVGYYGAYADSIKSFKTHEAAESALLTAVIGEFEKQMGVSTE